MYSYVVLICCSSYVSTLFFFFVFFFKQKTAYEMRISDWSSDVCSSDLHDVTRDQPPPGRFDIILCRNLLLYLPPDTRREVFERLHRAIAPDGALLLGAAETIIGQTDRFEPDPGFRGLYRLRKERAASRIKGMAAAQDG